jgi:DNA-binding LytR/AlgR family response regulator
LKFYSNYEASFDIIFTDIEMPYMNGLDAAKKIREFDKKVQIIFVSKAAQYAVRGYEVDAVGYALKPVSFFTVSELLNKAIKKLSILEDDYIVFNDGNGLRKISIPSIVFIEVRDHDLYYHLDDNNTYCNKRTPLSSLEEKIKNKGFSKCNNCYLINLKFVKMIKKDSILVGNEELPLSRGKKRDFEKDFISFAGEYL